MDIKTIISALQLLVAGALVVLVVIQDSGSGMGEAIGGGSQGFSQQRRGLAKGMFVATIVGLALFIATSLANLLIK